MATLEQNIYARLSAVCPRVFPDVAPVGTVKPYITWQQIGGDAPLFADQTAPSKRNADVQVNVWGGTRAEVNAMSIAAQNALCYPPTSEFCATPTGAFVATYDDDNLVYGAQQDFTMWNNY